MQKSIPKTLGNRCQNMFKVNNKDTKMRSTDNSTKVQLNKKERKSISNKAYKQPLRITL